MDLLIRLVAVTYDGLLDLDGGAGGLVVGSEPRAGTYLPTPVAYDGGIHVLTGFFTLSPWAYNGKIFARAKRFVVESGETFKLPRTNSLDEMAQATPAIIGDRLLPLTESKLYSIGRVQ